MPASAPAVGRTTSVRLPTPADRHLLSRFSWGVTPALTSEAREAGGALSWFNRQLYPGRINDRATDGLRSWFPLMTGSPQELWQRQVRQIYGGWEVSADFARWTMLRRMLSHRQVHECMVDFWSNLLHVAAPDDAAWTYRLPYDGVIRRHALGRFDQMLGAAIIHPAMSIYLDNATSTAENPNENLGRELLELHTVGTGAGYDEGDVRNSAYILTGYFVDVRGTWNADYRPDLHWRGRVNVLDFSDANASADGRAVVQRYLSYLAHHPSTARRVANRLAVRFVSDDPSPALVSYLANVFQSSGTDIKATLKALVRHPEFAQSIGKKVRTPVEDAVATYRVLGVQPRKPTTENSFASAILYQANSMGQRPFNWGRPDGFPDIAAAWTGVSRVLNSFDVHHSAAGGIWPPNDVRYRSPQSFLPALPSSLGDVVDHVSRQLLARPASDLLKSAVVAKIDKSMRTRIRSRDDMPDWRMIPLLATVLDTPAHMSR